VETLTADLQVYNQLKKRVQASTFKKDLLRNIQVTLPVCSPLPTPYASDIDILLNLSKCI
jgi:hypothetical protein